MSASRTPFSWTAVAVALLLLLLSTLALGQTALDGDLATSWSLSQPGHRWTCDSTSWHPGDVVFAQHGTQVWTGLWGSTTADPHALLLSRHASHPAEAAWVSGGPTTEEKAFMARAASEADVHVVTTWEDTATVNQRVFRLRKSSTHGPDWVYTHPQLGYGYVVCDVSADGQVILAAFPDVVAERIDVLVFGPDSPAPVAQYVMDPGGLWGLQLAADGARAVFAWGSVVRVLELADGSVHDLHDSSPAVLSNRGVAISGDGSLVACNVDGGMALYTWQGAADGYVQTWFRPIGNGTGEVALSRDGSTLVYGFDFGWFDTRILTECVDVASGALLVSEDISSPGAFGNGVSDVAVTPDGRIFAAATWGDEPGEVAELRVFARHLPEPILTFDLPGTALSVELSPDGRWLTSSSMHEHTHLPNIGGRVDLFHLGRGDFDLHGTPALGASVEFEIFGKPGRFAWLLDAPAPAQPPLVLPHVGTLQLDPVDLRLTPVGPIDASGSRLVSWLQPSDPALVGQSRWFQGLTTDTREWLTDDWLVVTNLP